VPKPNRGFYLTRDKRSGVYTIQWMDAGQRRTRSTGTRDIGAAQQALGRFLAELGKPAPKGHTVATVLEAWRDHRPRIASRQVASKCRQLIAAIGDRPAESIDGPAMRAYVRDAQARGLGSGTIGEHTKTLRAALNWAHAEGLIPAPAKFPRRAPSPPRDRWLTRDEADRLLDACKSAHVRLFTLLAIMTGARSEAILDLRWSDVDLDGGVIRYPAKPGGKPRAAVPINRTLAAALSAAYASRTTEHVVEWAGGRVHTIWTTFKRTARSCGLHDVTAHDLRRTAGHWMLQGGVPIEQVAAILGHRGITVTLRVYAKLYPAQLTGAVGALDRQAPVAKVVRG
jgi:integrase